MATLATLVALTASAQSASPAQPDAVDVRLLESTLVEAMHARDRQRLESLLAPDYVQGGLGWTGEQRLDQMSLRFATATGAVDYSWTVAPGTELREEAAVYADLESAGNWRTSSTAAVSVALTRVLSLRASHAIEYRRTPVVGFGRSDMRTAVAFVLSMARRPPIR